MQFEYSDLNRDKDEIRLLQIQPASDLSSRIECRLVHVSLQEAPYYEALSYTWGGNHFPEQILVNGHPFQVTENLKEALTALRDISKTRDLWVDAICINQRNNSEKSNEVLRILSVYKHAAHVRIWLGEVSDNSGLAFDYLEQLADDWATYRTFKDRFYDTMWLLASILSSAVQFGFIWVCVVLRWPAFGFGTSYYFLLAPKNGLFNYMLNSLVLFVIFSCSGTITCLRWWKAAPWLVWRDAYPEPGPTLIQALKDLFGRGWWKRTWIIQEIASAQKATFVCGLRELDIHRLTDAVDHIGYLIDNHDGKSNSPYLETEYQRVHVMMGVLGFEGVPEVQKQKSSLLFLLNQFSHHDAGDPRDKIYGLLGLAQDVRTISPDYNTTVREVYIDAAKKIVETNNDLNILRSCLFADFSIVDLPSWVPDWTIKQTRSVSGKVSMRGPYQLPDDYGQGRVAAFLTSEESLEVQGILVATLQDDMTESTVDGKVGDLDVKVYLEAIMRFAGPLLALLQIPISFTWFVFRWMLRRGWLPFHVSAGVHRFVRVWESYKTPSMPAEEMWRRTPPRWHFPKTLAAYNPLAHAKGREVEKLFTWQLASLGPETIQDGKTSITTWAHHARSGDLVAFLVGAKMPVLLRVDGQGSAESTSKARRFRLVGPASFAIYMDSYVWEDIRERYAKGVREVERIEIV